MAARFSHDHAWINTLFRVGVFGFAIATYFVGAVTLTLGTLLSALYLTYWWLRDGIWYSYSLAEMFARESAPDRPAESEAWIFETPLLVAMPTVGGTLTVAGLAVLFSVGLLAGADRNRV
jgi:hypothetical protein